MKQIISTLMLLSFLLHQKAAAQDEVFYNNFGCNIGWSFASPQTSVFKGFKDHFDAETGFQHKPMELGAFANGGSFGFSIFSGNCYLDFEYRALGLTSKYTMQAKPTETEQEYAFRLYQHSARFSYNYGKSFDKWGMSGIYIGAGLYAGTWGLRAKEPGRKMQKQSVDDWQGFAVGISPQLTLRLRFIELKGFYDFPFMETNMAPAYNKLYSTMNVPDAGNDQNLKGRIGHAGVCASFFIPFGKPSPRAVPMDDGRAAPAPSQPYEYKPAQKSENEKSRERIDKMNSDWEKSERRWNEKWNR